MERRDSDILNLIFGEYIIVMKFWLSKMMVARIFHSRQCNFHIKLKKAGQIPCYISLVEIAKNCVKYKLSKYIQCFPWYYHSNPSKKGRYIISRLYIISSKGTSKVLFSEIISRLNFTRVVNPRSRVCASNYDVPCISESCVRLVRLSWLPRDAAVKSGERETSGQASGRCNMRSRRDVC